MLIQNLDNPRYVELVLGTLDNLADKLADAGRTAGSFSEWQRHTRQSSLGAPSKTPAAQGEFSRRATRILRRLARTRTSQGGRLTWPAKSNPTKSRNDRLVERSPGRCARPARVIWRWTVLAVLVLGLCWSAPLIDELEHSPATCR